MNPMRTLAGFAALVLLGGLIDARPVAAADYSDFALGKNAESQDCRAQWRFTGTQDPDSVDLYCGAWEKPSGEVGLATADRSCKGDARLVESSSAITVRQVLCEADADGLRRVAIIAEAGGRRVVGSAFPADWQPMARASRVLLGVDRPERASSSTSPGLAEIEAAFPQGAPGRAAAANYELLRRRAYEYNLAWSFEASGRDFAELLRAHEKVAPDDAAGRADIEAELALNLSSARRFEEAADLLDQAEAHARAADARLLVSKIQNYRAMDALNQNHQQEAIRLAKVALDSRRSLNSGADAPAASQGVSASQSRWASANGQRRARQLVLDLETVSERDKAAVLDAQAWFILGAAERRSNPEQAEAALAKAESVLLSGAVQPIWIGALINEERSGLALERGRAALAESEARTGLERIRSVAPRTRAEARLLFALANARRAQGDLAGALKFGRDAVVVLAGQREAPGMPAEAAAGHLTALYEAWSKGRDPALADEYFETLALVWDGAASRAAAQLAARLAAREGGEQVRLYQDAERAYRAALARRRRVADDDAAAIKLADQDIDLAAKALGLAEAKVRTVSPRYLELLSPRLATSDLKGALGQGEAYLRIVLAQEGGFGASVTQAGVTPFRIGLGQAEADALVTKIRTSTRMKGRRLPDFDLASARSLYLGVIQPAEAGLAGVTDLHIDASGSLAAAPFAALLTADPDDVALQRVKEGQDYRGLPWLARRYKLDQALGPASFVRIRQAQADAPTPKIAAFGDFRPEPRLAAQRIATLRGLSDRCRDQIEKALAGLRALPSTAEEAREATSLIGGGSNAVLGRAFTNEAVLKDPNVADAEILLLATHGVLGLSACFAEPALLTSVGDGDGLIDASELLDRSIKARLVILSACDTAGGGKGDVGRSGLTDGGEALSGLARAFIYSGAKSVLATQWSVDAAASGAQTRALLTAAASTGAPLNAALNGAQALLYDEDETAHPFFWAGFTLIGDGRSKLVRPGI